MSWAEVMPLEIAATFKELAGGYAYSRLVEQLWLANRNKSARWASWRAQPHAMALLRKQYTERYRRDRATIVATRTCFVCKRTFEVNAQRARLARMSVCSRQCVGGVHKSNSILVTIGGKTHTLRRWAAIRGLPYDAVYQRIRSGWTHQKALTVPIRRKKVLA